MAIDRGPYIWMAFVVKHITVEVTLWPMLGRASPPKFAGWWPVPEDLLLTEPSYPCQDPPTTTATVPIPSFPFPYRDLLSFLMVFQTRQLQSLRPAFPFLVVSLFRAPRTGREGRLAATQWTGSTNQLAEHCLISLELSSSAFVHC